MYHFMFNEYKNIDKWVIPGESTFSKRVSLRLKYTI